MPARGLFILLSLLTVPLYAAQQESSEQDLELFEFLAMYDQEDRAYIETEMDDGAGDRTQQDITEQNLKTSNTHE